MRCFPPSLRLKPLPSALPPTAGTPATVSSLSHHHSRSHLLRRYISATSPRYLRTTPACPLLGRNSPGAVSEAEEERQRLEILAAREEERQAALAELENNSPDDAGGYGAANIRQRSPTNLPLPPDYTVAPTPQQAESLGYLSAESSEGLERVGNLKTWWEEDGHWGADDETATFAPPASVRVTDATLLEFFLRQALVEVLVRRQNEKMAGLAKGWARTDTKWTLRIAHMDVRLLPSNDVQIVGPVSELRQYLQTLAASESVALKPAEFQPLAITAEEAREAMGTWDKSWKNVPLQDEGIRFAIRKRLYQLTGRLIPDAKFAQMRTPQQFLAYLVTPPKPKKLAEELKRRGALFALPNVKVVDRRVTPIDKEKEVGRWKVIEEELKKRELPVTGHHQYGRMREKAWIKMKP